MSPAERLADLLHIARIKVLNHQAEINAAVDTAVGWVERFIENLEDRK